MEANAQEPKRLSDEDKQVCFAALAGYGNEGWLRDLKRHIAALEDKIAELTQCGPESPARIKDCHRYSIRIAPGMPDRTNCPHCGRHMVIEDGAFMTCFNDDCGYLLNPAMNALIDSLCRMNSDGRLGNEEFEWIIEQASNVLATEAQTTWDCLDAIGRAELEAGR